MSSSLSSVTLIPLPLPGAPTTGADTKVKTIQEQDHWNKILEREEAIRRARRIADLSVLDYLKELTDTENVWGLTSERQK